MRKDIEGQIEEEVPADLRSRVLRAAEPSLARNEAREGAREAWWAFLFRPVALGGMATAGAAAAVVFFVTQEKKAGELIVAASPMEFDQEMLAEAELLQDLDVLDNWEKLRKEWKPGKI